MSEPSSSSAAQPGLRGGAAPQAAARLVDRARGYAELLHNAAGRCFARVLVPGPVEWRRELCPVPSDRFHRWLAKVGGGPSPDVVKAALRMPEALALEGPEAPVFLRVAEHDGSIWIDLGDAEWSAIQVWPGGWRVTASGEVPVCFERPRGARALPPPQRSGLIGELRRFANVASEADFRLVVAHSVRCLMLWRPHPILGVVAKPGSGKSSLFCGMRLLTDPRGWDEAVRSPPNSVRDLGVAANNNWCLCFDNLSRVPPWLRDALCMRVTGGAFAIRQNWSDDQEIVLNLRGPTMLGSITDVIRRGDLADRTIRVEMDPG
jgi:hypothetical protein